MKTKLSTLTGEQREEADKILRTFFSKLNDKELYEWFNDVLYENMKEYITAELARREKGYIFMLDDMIDEIIAEG